MARAGNRIASLSLDLDNQWSYMKTHGEDGWADFPSYLDWTIPRILKFLRERDVAITFFIVGQDAALPANGDALRSIADAGHEIGNHSFNHEPWLHLYSESEIDEELAKAEEAIEKATGRRPVGFRGPGFSLSETTLRVLQQRGYMYDATVFPNVLNPLARMYFFATSNLSKEEKEQRKELFGTWRDALRPLKPFKWDMEGDSIMEIPVTTMPVFKFPIHLSYILYASRISKRLAMAYFKFAMLMCRVTGVSPSILLHPLDFVGGEELQELSFFPGMTIDLETKLEIVGAVIDEMKKHYELVTVREHIEGTQDSCRTLRLQES